MKVTVGVKSVNTSDDYTLFVVDKKLFFHVAKIGEDIKVFFSPVPAAHMALSDNSTRLGNGSRVDITTDTAEPEKGETDGRPETSTPAE